MINITEMASKIKSKGGNLYLVGGAVRDELLGLEVHDEDYSVTGISPNEFKELFPKIKARGKDFPVFSIDNKEFAIARKERKIGLGHSSFNVDIDKKITIEEDLERRDITINAIAKNVLTGEIVDPFKGREDLENKIIRAVSGHFSEDPLRAYRVARFASQLGFKVENETVNMMKLLKNEIAYLSVERVYNEFSKALLTNKPSIFFNVLRKSDLLNVHFKEIYDLIGAGQPIEYHPEGDAYNHTMIVLDKVADKTIEMNNARKLELRFSALVHDLGKGATPKEEYPHHIGHEQRGSELVIVMGNRLKIPTRLIKCGKTACLEHMRGGIFDKMSVGKKVGFIERINHTLLGLYGLQLIVDADNMNGDSCKNQFYSIGYGVINCTNGSKIMKEYDLKEGTAVANKMHEVRVTYLKTKQI